MSAISLPISKEQFLNSIPSFINIYKRLPYENGDDIEVEIINNDGEKETHPYKASRYILEYYSNQNKLTEALFKDNIITYKSIGNTLGYTETVIRNAITKSIKNPDVKLRRAIDIYFNKDYYEELGKYNENYCMNCTKAKNCRQEYWIAVVCCPKYNEKKKK